MSKAENSMMDEPVASDTPRPNVAAALEAIGRGFQPIPIVTGGKKPMIPGWPNLHWDNTQDGLKTAQAEFERWGDEEHDHRNVGVLLGERGGSLIDVDLDHPKTRRLQDHFLPPTPAVSGRGNRPNTHYWYRAREGTLQGTKQFRMPRQTSGAEGQMIVEYRSTGGQTVIPPSQHPEGDQYEWTGEPWGGAEGPAEVDGRALALQVALLGLCTLLVDNWPKQGGRNSAFLALAGGLLRVGEGIHPYWERNAEVVIEAIGDATGDEDGGRTRVSETLKPTIRRLRSGKSASGWGNLAKLIGDDTVKQARNILAEIESLAGLPPRTSANFSIAGANAALEQAAAQRTATAGSPPPAGPITHAERLERLGGSLPREDDETLPSEDFTAPDAGDGSLDPLEQREGTWEALDLEPYLAGEVQSVMPTLLDRVDGQSLLYPGRLNMLYGNSESAKSWLSMFTAIQVLEVGGRVVYLDFEDEPVNAIQRMKLLGASDDDLRKSFRYVRPEDPLAPMQRSKWGEDRSTEVGLLNNRIFTELLEKHDPTLVVADGMTMLYSLHGLDTNDSVQTDIITTWLKTLTRNGRSTVIVVDHAPKNSERGALPLGSQHKVSMVQGSLLQTYPTSQPMPGAVGEVELIVLKDRPGQVRAVASKTGKKAQLVAKFIMDSTQSGVVRATLEAPTAAATATSGPQTLDLSQSRAAERSELKLQRRDAILALFDNQLGRQLTLKEVLAGLPNKRLPGTEGASSKTSARLAALRKVLDDYLVTDGYLMRERRGQAVVYTLAMADPD